MSPKIEKSASDKVGDRVRPTDSGSSRIRGIDDDGSSSIKPPKVPPAAVLSQRTRSVEFVAFARNLGKTTTVLGHRRALEAYLKTSKLSPEEARSLARGFDDGESRVVTFSRACSLMRYATSKERLKGRWFWQPGTQATPESLALDPQHRPKWAGIVKLPKGQKAVVGVAGPLNGEPGGDFQIMLLNVGRQTIQQAIELDAMAWRKPGQRRGPIPVSSSVPTTRRLVVFIRVDEPESGPTFNLIGVSEDPGQI